MIRLYSSSMMSIIDFNKVTFLGSKAKNTLPTVLVYQLFLSKCLKQYFYFIVSRFSSPSCLICQQCFCISATRANDATNLTETKKQSSKSVPWLSCKLKTCDKAVELLQLLANHPDESKQAFFCVFMFSFVCYNCIKNINGSKHRTQIQISGDNHCLSWRSYWET